jgi:hypothetical protein
MRTTDGGTSFADHRPGAARDVHCLTWHPEVRGRAYEAGGDGSAWSRDAGESWSQVAEGRDRSYTWALAVDPEDPDRWYISAAPGPFKAHGRGPADSVIYRWEDGGPWHAVYGPLDSHAYALAATDGRLVAGLGDGTLLESADRGDTWTELDESVGRVTAIVAR